MEALLTLIVVAMILVPMRLVTASMDRDRIRRYIESRGGVVIRVRWSPLGPGWWGNRTQRIYRVVFRDKDGNEHSAYCKTSMWTGVYFTEDTVVQYRLVTVPQDKCIACGYNLTGNESGICPECGEVTPAVKFNENKPVE